MKWGTSEPDGEHRRQTFRFTASGPSDALLSIDGRDMRVRIRDESAGGFGVVVEERFAENGDIGVLRMIAAACEVRVANVSKELPPCGGQGGVRYCLGLQRLRDLPLAPADSEQASWLRRLFPAEFHGPSVSTAAPVAVFGTLVAMLIAVILWSCYAH